MECQDHQKNKEKYYENENFKQLVELRRALHQIPEIGLQEHETSKFIRKYLSQINGVQLQQPIPGLPTAVIARINILNCQQKYLFRCQLDALGWQERSGQQFQAKNGFHHACGHDAHMAMMLLACKKIADKKQNLARSIIFCFQPGQQGKGGANMLFNKYPQLLDSVTYAFAIHGGNNYSSGNVLVSPGVISANSERFEITIKGHACHVMIPESAIDANYIGCSLVTQLYSLKLIKLSPLERGIFCVTKVEGGSGLAIISDIFKITGTVRMLSAKAQQKMKQQIEKLSISFCKSFGAECEVKYFASYYRQVQNHQKPTKIVQQVISQIFTKSGIKQQQASFNGQDFCEFSQRVPSCYLMLGAGLENSFDSNNQSIFPIHSNRHRLDQKFMSFGLEIWTKLAFFKESAVGLIL